MANLLRKPLNCGIDSNFRITTPPTFVDQRHEIPCMPHVHFDQQEAPVIPDECNFLDAIGRKNCTIAGKTSNKFKKESY